MIMPGRFSKIIYGLLLFFLLSLTSGPAVAVEPTDAAPRDIFIGVLAKRGAALCLQRWRPLADYLSHKISGKRFHIVALPFDQVEAAVVEERVDFILVNPSLYINLEVKYKVSRILTMIQKTGDFLSAEFGGVLFHLAGRSELNDMMAVRGRTLVAVDETSFGGWQTVYYELHELGLSLKYDLQGLRFAGSHDQVVYDVLAGRADFGVVRTGVLESMSRDGLIDLKRLEVVYEHGGGRNHLPFLHSTRAYPEWALARMELTDDALSKKVALALLALQPADEVCRRCEIGGWSTALSYFSVHNLLQTLKLPPYEHLGQVTVAQVFRQYYYFIVSLLLAFLLIVGAVVNLLRVNRRVRALQEIQKKTIADLHLAEEHARARGYMAQELLDAIPMPVFYLDRQGNYRGCNQAFEKFSGFRKKALRGHPAATLAVAGNLMVVKEEDFKLMLKGGGWTREMELEGQHGRHSFLEIRISVYRERDRSPAGLIGLINDLTSHKFMVRRMAQLGAVVEQAAESIVVTDLDGKIQYVNPAFEKLTGYAMSEAIGKNSSLLKSGRQDESFYRELWETLGRGETWKGIFANKRKDGSLFDEDATIFPIRNDYGEIISLAAVKRDISREKAMQVQLRTSQRLEAVGQLAAGVAHELNTPIGFVASNFESITGYIKNFVQLIDLYRETLAKLADQLPETGPEALACTRELEEELQIEFILEDLEDLFSESKDGFARITSIVTKLREFSRIDQMDTKESFNFNRAVDTTLIVARNEYKYSAEVDSDLDPQLPDVMASGGEINQVILNLLVNAAQAIKEQERESLGHIKITTDYDEEWVRCRIADDGPGIKPENLERIFDPFFTTKPVGKGTGLGLNISYDIVVNKHKGTLTVTSELGKGTVFVIALPRRSGGGAQEEKQA
ncbi:MAG: PAS domain S-box protein [Deltaproteobacteria bacterium]|nr:PAS domain S-box protein [Deltaproteobacteria bacterium]